MVYAGHLQDEGETRLETIKLNLFINNFTNLTPNEKINRINQQCELYFNKNEWVGKMGFGEDVQWCKRVLMSETTKLG